jgi:hypothetical protein
MKYVLMKKTESQKSRDTVSLILIGGLTTQPFARNQSHSFLYNDVQISIERKTLQKCSAVNVIPV